ncbi:ATP binding [Arthrobotrys musiformis]|uniref:mitogen-activated protein kinase kinase kinase n=1 Tax=Arthrobotrys musiformis TaxID=47236 RepID=A0AAV9WDF6_9PEZI
MAMLASKSQYTHTPTYVSVPYHPAGPSPTNSEFSEHYNHPDDVRNWDELRVGEWLGTINCGQYEGIFRRNNITGDTLLDVDQAILKQLGITKVGDRVRIYAAIKALRNKITANSIKNRNRKTLLALDSIATLPSIPPSYEAPRAGSFSSSSPGLGRNPYAAEESPKDDKFRRPKASLDRSNKYASGTASSVLVTARPTVAASIVSDGQKSAGLAGNTQSTGFVPKHGTKPSIDGGIMKMPNVQPNYVKFIGSEGSTRVVAISGAKTAELILQRALKKFGLNDENPANWSVFVTADKSTRYLSDAELVKICHDVSRPERERLILRPRKNGYPSAPTVPEYQRAQEIAKEQAEFAKQQQVLQQQIVEYDTVQSQSDTLTGLRSESSKPNLLEPPGGNNSRPISPALSSRSRDSTVKPLKDFFGQRPPSELISSNLAEYFPDQDSKVLKKTIRNSMRHSRHMSRMSRMSRMSSASRMSTATTMSFADSISGAPPVPSIGDTWLNASKSGAGVDVGGKKRRPMSRRPVSNYSVDRSLSMLEEEVVTPRLPKSQTLRPRFSTTLSEADTDDSKSYLDESDNTSTTDMDTEPEEPRASGLAPAPPVIRASPMQHHNLLMQLLNYEDKDSKDDDDDDEDTAGPDTFKKLTAKSDDVPDAAAERLSVSSAQDDYDDEEEEEEEEEEDEDEYDDEDDEDEDDDDDAEGKGDDNLHTSSNGMRWIRGALIGQGSFGSVYLALDAMSGALMAVKQVPSNAGHGESRKKSMMESLEREIALLKDLQHENIVQYLGSDSEPDCLNIFLEYVPGGSVAAMLSQYGPLPEPLVRNFVRQILTGLNYLHNKDIIHRDIKGANVLVDNRGGIKISDFGISKKVESGLMSQAMSHRASMQGSVFWMAPEVVKQTAYTRKADIWSLGCLIVEMFTGDHPFPGCSQFQAIFKIGSLSVTPTIPAKCSAEATTFLEKTFIIDHTKRPTAEELLGFPFMKMVVA